MEPFGQWPPPRDVEAAVRAAQSGDPAALDDLVRTLTPYIGRICGAIALDEGDDAMQETLIAVVRSLRSLREPAAAKAWVRRIAVREAVRVASRRPAIADGDEEIEVHLPDVEAALDVRAVLATLAPAQRAVLVLRDLDGLSEAEVAEVLAIPEGTVKSRLHRARAAFERRWAR